MAANHLEHWQIDTVLDQEIRDGNGGQTFENFCVDLLGRVTTFGFVNTSRNYDKGRDGRSIETLASRQGSFIACAIHASDPFKKAVDDYEKLIEGNSEPKRFTFCYGSNITESTRDKIIGYIRSYDPHLKIEVHGRVQIKQFASHHSDLFIKWYGGKIQSIWRTFVLNGASQTESLLPLRTALAFQFSPNAAAFREGLLDHAVLASLPERGPLEPCDIAARLNTDLSLLVEISNTQIDASCVRLNGRGLVSFNGHAARITADGEVLRSTQMQAGTARLLSLRSSIYTALHGRVSALTDSDFDTLWQAMEKAISAAFYLSGHEIILAVGSLLHPQRRQFRAQPVSIILRQHLLHAIEITPSVSHEIRGDLAAIIVEEMLAPSSPAFEWLTHLACGFLCLCSLGLNAELQIVAQSFIARHQLLPDTHVLLSYLGEESGLPVPIKQVFQSWAALGGATLLSDAILTEVLAHAALGRAAFHDFWEDRRARGMQDQDDHTLAARNPNVFVRGFVASAAAKGWDVSPGSFASYMENFLHGKARDTSLILATLESSMPAKRLHPRLNDDPSLGRRVKSVMLQRLNLPSHAADNDFADLRQSVDHKFILDFIHKRRADKADGQGRVACIVSSHGDLRRWCEEFAAEIGYEEPVISLTSVAYLLTLLPTSAVNLDVLRQVLFSDHSSFSSPLHDEAGKEALVAIANPSFDPFSLPTLRRQLLKRLQ